MTNIFFLQNGKSPGSIVVNIASPKPDDGEREEGEIKDGDESIQILERFVTKLNAYDWLISFLWLLIEF
jgi:hypothetical protein